MAAGAAILASSPVVQPLSLLDLSRRACSAPAKASLVGFQGLRKENAVLSRSCGVNSTSSSPFCKRHSLVKSGKDLRQLRVEASANGGPQSFDYDVIIIGAGVGGHGAALHAVEKVGAFPGISACTSIFLQHFVRRLHCSLDSFVFILHLTMHSKKCEGRTIRFSMQPPHVSSCPCVMCIPLMNLIFFPWDTLKAKA